MPKKPKFIHPVRALREVIREIDSTMTQDKFAKLVGVSKPLINAVEAGQRALTLPIARRISLATGSCAESLMKKSGKPKTLYGKEYTVKTFQEWKAPKTDEPLRTAAVEEDHYRVVKSVGLLLRAAGAQKKFSELHLDLSYWIKDARDRFGLAPTFNRLLRESDKSQS